jgi:hypothetical protein
MRRDQLAHILRAAAAIVEDGDMLVIGSQSILGSYDEDDLPDRAVASVEVDIAFFDDPDASKADLVDGVIGEMSPFHELHGVYGQGVEVKTATLPPGWRARAVHFDRDDTGDARAFCLDPHDLVISKLIAGRDKDLEFTQALLDAGLVEQQVLDQRVSEMRIQRSLDTPALQRLQTTVEGFSPPPTQF